MKYKVRITESIEKSVIIDADSKDEAYDIVEGMYIRGNITLSDKYDYPGVKISTPHVATEKEIDLYHDVTNEHREFQHQKHDAALYLAAKLKGYESYLEKTAGEIKSIEDAASVVEANDGRLGSLVDALEKEGSTKAGEILLAITSYADNFLDGYVVGSDYIPNPELVELFFPSKAEDRDKSIDLDTEL